MRNVDETGMQNRYEAAMGLRPFESRMSVERCIGNLWKRDCKEEHKGYILGGEHSKEVPK